MKSGVAIGDLVGGLYGVISVLAGLTAVRSGKTPVPVDVALLDAQVALLSFLAGYQFTTGESLPRMSSRHVTNFPWGTYRTLDSYVVVAAAHDHFWRALCTAFGREDLGSDARYETNEARVRLREELEPHVTNMFAHRRTAEILFSLREAGVPAANVRSLEEVLTDVDLVERAMVVDIAHPSGGSYRAVGSPIGMTEPMVDGKQRLSPPPLLGAHTREVLSTIASYSEQRIDQLVAENVVGIA